MTKVRRNLVAFFMMLAAPLFAANRAGISDGMLLLLMIILIGVLLLIISFLTNSIRNLTRNKELWKSVWNRSDKVPVILLIGGMIMAPQNTMAGTDTGFVLNQTNFWFLVGIIIVLLLVVIYLLSTLQGLLNQLTPKEEKAPGFLESVSQQLTDSIPVERESEVLTDHDYDGIKELDNNLPPWWVAMFYITIIFSIIYVFRYHISGSGEVMMDEYRAEIIAAEELKALVAEEGPVLDASTVTLFEGDMTRAKQMYETNCASCHGSAGEGGVGPNLTDEYWKHGGGISNLFETIQNGVPAKGMIAWKSILKPEHIREVSSYILTMQGTNPPNGKAPEGDLWVEEASPVSTDSASVPADTSGTVADTTEAL